MWWGFSPALNLLDEYDEKNDNASGDKEETCNVLLLGQCDGRHVLKTIAEKYRQKKNINCNLYIHEPLLENVARQLLFTTIALEPPEQVGIAEKTLFFLELYGNSLIRPATCKYLTKLSKRLLNMITDVDYANKILPSVSLNSLKYKERDQLEVIFKYWALPEKSFNILNNWDERLRKYLGVRYDTRNGAYDWDYHMRYHPFGADALNLQEYKKFREKGISFHFEDTDPCVSNCTLESAIFSAGSKIKSYGYFGDIITGPYVTFGLTCEDKDMYKKVNGKMCKSATDFTERNLMRIFYEIQHKSPFVPVTDCEESTPVVLVDTSCTLKVLPRESCDAEAAKIKIKDACEVYESLGTNNCNIIFTPTTALKDYISKPEFENFFDLIYISHALVLKHIKPELFKMFKANSKIIVETPKYLLNYRKEDLEKFKTQLENLMTDCGCKVINSYNSEKDEFARFSLEK